MKKFLFVLSGLGLLALSMFILMPKPVNEPPHMSADLYPSCHWDGSENESNWRVEFHEDRFNSKTKHWTAIWRQTVAIGVSEKAAERLCDAYTQIGFKEK